MLPTTATVNAVGELDASTASGLVSQLLKKDADVVILDMTDVTFMDAHTLGEIINVHHTFDASQQTLLITGLRNFHLKIIRMLQLNSILHVV